MWSVNSGNRPRPRTSIGDRPGDGRCRTARAGTRPAGTGAARSRGGPWRRAAGPIRKGCGREHAGAGCGAGGGRRAGASPCRPSRTCPTWPTPGDSVAVTHRGPVALPTGAAAAPRRVPHDLIAWHESRGSRFWRMSSAGTLEGGDVHILRPGLAAVARRTGARIWRAPGNSLAGSGRRVGRCGSSPSTSIFCTSTSCSAWRRPGSPWPCLDVLGGGASSDRGAATTASPHGIRRRRLPAAAPGSGAESCGSAANVLALGEGRVVSSPRDDRGVNAAARRKGCRCRRACLGLSCATRDRPAGHPDREAAVGLFTAGGGGPQVSA